MIMLFSAHKGRIGCISGAAGAGAGCVDFQCGRCPGAWLEAPGRRRWTVEACGGVLVPADADRGATGHVGGDGMEERQAWLKSCVERRGPGAYCIECAGACSTLPGREE
jgi:hypothetical protein